MGFIQLKAPGDGSLCFCRTREKEKKREKGKGGKVAERRGCRRGNNVRKGEKGGKNLKKNWETEKIKMREREKERERCLGKENVIEVDQSTF